MIVRRDNNTALKKLLTVLTVLLPIADEYSLQNINGSVADWTLVVIVALYILLIGVRRRVFKIDEYSGFLLVAIYGIFSLLLNCNSISVFSDYIRFLFIYFFVIFISKKYLDFQYGLKAIEILGFVNCIYSDLQLVAIRIMNVYLPSYLPFLEHREDLKTEFNYLNYSQFYRPHSIFSEPSHFAEYVLLSLIAILFFYYGNKTTKYIVAGFISLSLLLTGSTTAVLGTTLIWVFYILKLAKERELKFNPKIGLIVILAIAIFFVIIIRSSSFQIFVTRFFEDHSTVTLRLGDSKSLRNITGINSVFGIGLKYDYVAEKFGWLPSYGLIYAYFGIVGEVLYIIAFFYMAVKLKKNRTSKLILLFFLIMNIATELMLDCYMILYLMLCTNEHFYRQVVKK